MADTYFAGTDNILYVKKGERSLKTNKNKK